MDIVFFVRETHVTIQDRHRVHFFYLLAITLSDVSMKLYTQAIQEKKKSPSMLKISNKETICSRAFTIYKWF